MWGVIPIIEFNANMQITGIPHGRHKVVQSAIHGQQSTPTTYTKSHIERDIADALKIKKREKYVFYACAWNNMGYRGISWDIVHHNGITP